MEYNSYKHCIWLLLALEKRSLYGSVKADNLFGFVVEQEYISLYHHNYMDV